MGARYIFEKYNFYVFQNKEIVAGGNQIHIGIIKELAVDVIFFPNNPTSVIKLYNGYKYAVPNQYGSFVKIDNQQQAVGVRSNPYIAIVGEYNEKRYIYRLFTSTESYGNWEFSYTDGSDSSETYFSLKLSSGSIQEITLNCSLGAKVGESSFDSNIAEPFSEIGESNYWYIYKGSDSIDPVAINYPTADLESGQSLNVTVTPSTSNEYGGTITYQYQYSRNNGAWTDLKSTTDTSVSYTIPEGTSNIQFRVQASDNMGFTSTDYVTGVNAAVSQLKAYVGINGKARKADKIYVGVNGKARQVIKGYIGVDGKARKFL